MPAVQQSSKILWTELMASFWPGFDKDGNLTADWTLCAVVSVSSPSQIYAVGHVHRLGLWKIPISPASEAAVLGGRANLNRRAAIILGFDTFLI